MPIVRYLAAAGFHQILIFTDFNFSDKLVTLAVKHLHMSFGQYESQWQSSMSSARSVLASGENAKLSALIEAQNSLVEARGAIAAMYASIRGGPGQGDVISKAKKKKINRLEKEMDPLEEEIERALHNAERNELFSTSIANTSQNNNGSLMDPFGAKLVSTMGELNEQTSMINNSQQLCAETEQVGASILGTMGTQREQLLNANDRVKETRGFAGQARSLLKSMGRRALCYRLFLYFIILALIAGNITVLYFGYFKSNK